MADETEGFVPEPGPELELGLPPNRPVARWRKLPVEIEARQVTPRNAMQVAEWCGGRAYAPENADLACIDIVTLEGTMTAGLDDWVIKGVANEFYPCKADVFARTYEPASPVPAEAGGAGDDPLSARDEFRMMEAIKATLEGTLGSIAHVIPLHDAVDLLARRCAAAESEVMRLKGVTVLPGMPGAEL